MLDEQGRTPQVYDAMRTQGFAREARQYLHRGRNHDAVATRYSRQLVAAHSSLDAVAEHDTLGRERALCLVHDLTVKLAEVLRERGRDGPVLARGLWNDLERLHPGDLAVLERKASTAEWNHAWVDAAGYLRELVLARAALAALPPAVRRIWSGQLLTSASSPPDAPGRAAGWQRVRARARSGGMLDPTADWLGIVYAELMQSNHEAAARGVDGLLELGDRWSQTAADIEVLLAVEDFGPQKGRVQESLERWRATRSPSDDR